MRVSNASVVVLALGGNESGHWTCNRKKRASLAKVCRPLLVASQREARKRRILVRWVYDLPVNPLSLSPRVGVYPPQEGYTLRGALRNHPFGPVRNPP